MKVKRTIKCNVDTFNVGDIIKVKLTDGVKVRAMAMQQEEGGTIFCLVDCLPGEYQMNSTGNNKGGYKESDLCKKLNSELLNLFPAKLKALMVPFINGDLLRLPTEKEIFGENYYGEHESPYMKQWKAMKNRRSRIAFDGTKQENVQWYWLTNGIRGSSTEFSISLGDGRSHYDNASAAVGVRPVFKLRNSLEELNHE